MNEVIYLEPDDEITGVIDRVRASHSLGVVLVMPRGSALAQSIVNLKLLKRSAENLKKEVSLVTNDRITRNLASQIGVTVYSKVSEAEHAAPKPVVATKDQGTPSQEPAAIPGIKVNTYSRYGSDDSPAEDNAADSNSVLEPAEPDAAKEPAETVAEPSSKSNWKPATVVSSPVSKPGSARSILSASAKISGRRGRPKNKKILVFISVVIISLLVLSYLIIPYAKASVVLKTEDFSSDQQIAVDRQITELSIDKKAVPGVLLESQKETTKNFPSTGKKEIGEKAKGKVTVYNNFDSSAHKYSKGTKLTSQGKVFTADTDFTASAASISLVGGKVNVAPGEVTVDVTASLPGDVYNLEAASTYTIENAPAQIFGKGTQMAGGLSKQVSVVEEVDLDKAAEDLRTSLISEAKSDVFKQAEAQGLTLAEGAVTSETLAVNNSKSVGEEAENFDVNLKIKVYGVGFKDKDVRDLAVRLAENSFSENKMIVGPEKADFHYEPIVTEDAAAGLNLKTSLTGKVGIRIASAAIQSSLRNKSKTEALKLLSEHEGVERASVTLWPQQLNRLPFFASRIAIVFDYNK